jgi:hypothetical protein
MSPAPYVVIRTKNRGYRRRGSNQKKPPFKTINPMLQHRNNCLNNPDENDTGQLTFIGTVIILPNTTFCALFSGSVFQRHSRTLSV